MKSTYLAFLFLIAWVSYSSQNAIIGVNTAGGLGSGTIFGFSLDSNKLNLIKNIPIDMAGKNSYYNHLLKATNGKYYGATFKGGVSDNGVIYSYDPITNFYTKILDLGTSIGAARIKSSFCEANNGNLYAVSTIGGINGHGALIELNPTTNTCVKKIDFYYTLNANGPTGSLIKATNGKLYGLSYGGGSGNIGTLYEYDPTNNTVVKKVDFTGTTNGSNPCGALYQANDGLLYGLTRNGGATNNGTLFSYNILTNVLTKKIDFDGSGNGRRPEGSLIQHPNGKLYGLTLDGGNLYRGNLFEYNILTNSLITKIDFGDSNNASYPYCDLILGDNNLLYGLSGNGGVNDLGTMYKYNPINNVFNVFYEFYAAIGGSPISSFLYDNNMLYTPTYQNGIANCGSLIKYDIQNSICSKIFDFSTNGVWQGDMPIGKLVQGNNGNLYGITQKGGTNNLGTIFEYNLVLNTYTKQIDFTGALNGSTPCQNLLKASNGKFYGLTFNGGLFNHGVLFEYDDVTNTLTKKIDLKQTVTGSIPNAGLIEASNGKLYGVTQQYNNTNLESSLFEYSINTNSLVVLHDFVGSGGVDPVAEPLETIPGILYGTTNGGGQYNCGVIYKFNYNTNSYQVKHHFNATINDGCSSTGLLTLAPNGKLYGITNLGGDYSLGTVFELDTATNIYNQIHSFDSISGSNPINGFTLINNKLFGTTYNGGQYNHGVLFELDYITNTIIKHVDFKDSLTGKNPITYFTPVTINNINTNNLEIKMSQEFKIFPNPAKEFINLILPLNSKIEMFNLVGEKIYTKYYSEEYHTINVSSFQNGIYFIKISNTGFSETKKIIINKN